MEPCGTVRNSTDPDGHCTSSLNMKIDIQLLIGVKLEMHTHSVLNVYVLYPPNYRTQNIRDPGGPKTKEDI